jgi:hypothetical protein
MALGIAVGRAGVEVNIAVGGTRVPVGILVGNNTGNPGVALNTIRSGIPKTQATNVGPNIRARRSFVFGFFL